MKTRRNGILLGIGLAVVMTMAVPATTLGADRVVLGEYYNGTW